MQRFWKWWQVCWCSRCVQRPGLWCWPHRRGWAHSRPWRRPAGRGWLAWHRPMPRPGHSVQPGRQSTPGSHHWCWLAAPMISGLHRDSVGKGYSEINLLYTQLCQPYRLTAHLQALCNISCVKVRKFMSAHSYWTVFTIIFRQICQQLKGFSLLYTFHFMPNHNSTQKRRKKYTTEHLHIQYIIYGFNKNKKADCNLRGNCQ